MKELENVIQEYPNIVGLSLLIIGGLMTYYRLFYSEKFQKEDDYDTISGEYNAYYWGIITIVGIVGVILILK